MSLSNDDIDLHLQLRDLELLRGLLDCRLMTLAHTAAIHFDGHEEAAKKRVQKLKAAGLIAERARKPYEPSILFLTRSGFLMCRDRGLLQDLPELTWPGLERRLRVSDLTLRHELQVMDVKAAVCAALRVAEGKQVVEFITWPALVEFRASPGNCPDVQVKPDGFIRIQETEGSDIFEHAFFLELDRSTETLDTLARRALCYLNHYQSGGFAEWLGSPRSAYKEFPFRVLFVFKTAERRNNFAEQLLAQSPPILTLAWLATFEDVIADPLGPVWIRPRDYRDATDGTNHAVRQPAALVYRRQSERDQFIEHAISKHRLFEGGAVPEASQ